jgi:putative intracellular protease/amidase
MRYVTILFAAFCGLFLAVAPALAEPAPRALLVASGHGDGGRSRPGFEMDEFAQAWAVFRDNGFEVDVASPAGGAVQPDEYEADKSYNQRILADAAAMQALGQTIDTEAADPNAYSAIYVLGGGGAMFDLYADGALQALIARAYAQGAVVGGVCHGPAVLANVRLPGGRHLVEGRRVTGFSNAEEEMFGERWSASYPTLLETALRARGAAFEQGPAMLPHVVADGRLVTGQNPFSTARTVEAMVRALGREPARREPYADERSLILVGRFLAGERAQAAAELAAAPAAHDVMLIGIYGDILAAQAGQDAAKLRTALELMELAAARLWEPRLELSMASVERRLGNAAGARQRAERVLAREPANEPARRLLASLAE